MEDSTPENRRKSPRIEAQQREAILSPKPTKSKDSPLRESTDAKPEDPDNVVISGSHQSRKAILSPIKFVPESIQTSSVIKEKTHIPIPIPETKQKRKNTKKQKSDKPVNPAIIPTTATSVGASTPQPNQKAIQKSVLSTRLHPPSVPVKEIQSNTGQNGGTNPNKPEVLENIGIFQTCQPPRDHWITQGFTRKSRDLLKLVSAGLSCGFVNYEVNNYQCCCKQTSYSS